MTLRGLSILTVALGLMGCGSSVPGGGGGVATQTSIDAGNLVFSRFYADVFSGALNSPTTLPNSGSANFSGPIVISGDSPARFTILGDMSLNANFGSRVVNGSASRFGAVTDKNGDYFNFNNQYVLDHAVGGSLTVSNGYMNSSGFLGSKLAGTLTGVDSAGSSTKTGIDSPLVGSFFSFSGAGADVVYGGGSGSATVDGYSYSISTSFVVE